MSAENIKGRTEESFAHPQTKRCVTHDDMRRRALAAIRCRRRTLGGGRPESRGELLARLQHRARVVARGVQIMRGNECENERAEVVVKRFGRELQGALEMLSA